MGKEMDKVRMVTAQIAERITYEPYGETTTHHVAVCNCGGWKSAPWAKTGPKDREGVTRDVWAHVTAKHLDDAEPLANPDAQVVADTWNANR